MCSGAAHDAQNIPAIGPMGMIFVPSVDGISHDPKVCRTNALLWQLSPLTCLMFE